MSSLHLLGFGVLVHVTAMLAIASLLIWLCRGRSALQHTIGVLALILALCSPMLVFFLPRSNGILFRDESGVSLITTQQTNVVDVSTERQLELTEIVGLRDGLTAKPRSNESQRRTMANRRSNGRMLDGNVVVQLALSSLWAVWILGAAWVGYGIWRSRRTVQSLAHSWSDIPFDRLGQVQNAVSAALQWNRLPPVKVSDLTPMPMVFGIWKPVVVLPRNVVDSMDDSCLRDVLIHEIAHIVRRDPWIHALQHAASIVFWIHPGTEWLNRQISRTREELCDNFVIRYSDATEYAQTLLRLSEFRDQQRDSLTTLGLFKSKWALETRVRDLLNPKRPIATGTGWSTKMALGIVFSLISLSLGGIGVGRVSLAAQPSERSKSSNEQNSTKADKTTVAARKMKMVVVRGTCIDDKTNAVPNAQIRVYRYNNHSEAPLLLATTESDEKGGFRLENIESAADQQLWDLMLTVKSAGHSSSIRQILKQQYDDDIEITLSSNPQSLSGVVKDIHGNPVPNVLITAFPLPLPPDVRSDTTDENGHYSVGDLAEWKPNGVTTFFYLNHPDYPATRGSYTGIPQVVDVTLKPAAIFEGRVIDATTEEPVPNITVSAQGVARSGWFQAKTDEKGWYRLRMTKDHYNIWAEMDDRIAIAVKAIEAIPGETTTDVDIEMVEGGFVVGSLINGETNEPIPIPEGQIRYVAHYGPARPMTGAAVTTTVINPDGTYRLRVAPGMNYVYLMSGDMAEYVMVEDGEEVKFDLVSGRPKPEGAFISDPDSLLRSRLLQEAIREDQEESESNAK